MTGRDDGDPQDEAEGAGAEARVALPDESPFAAVAPTQPRQVDLARAGLLLTVVEALNVLVGFASTVYFAWALGASALGVFFLFDAVLNTVTTVTDFGLRDAVEKRISEGEAGDATLTAAVCLKLALLAPFVLLAYPLHPYVDAYIGAPLTLPLVAGVLAYESGVLTLHVLRAELRVEETALLSFARLAVYVLVAVALVQFDYGVRALVYAFIASYTVLLAVGALRVSTGLARPGRAQFRSLVRYAKYNGVSALGGYVYNSMDLLVVGYFLTPAFVAAYELAWRVTAMLLLVANVVSNTVFAQLSAWHARDELDRVGATLADAVTASLVLVIPAFVGIALLSREFLGVLFGPAFTVAAAAFVVLAGEKLVTAVNVVLDAGVRAFDRPQAGAYATVGSATLNVALNVVLVPRYGLLGAASATAAAVCLHGVVLAVALSRLTPLAVDARGLGWCVGAALGMGGVIALARTFVDAGTLVGLAALVALGGAVYLALVLASTRLRAKARGVAASLA
ncbi:lipopolysaccharide biosynthesis protein (plasmid) [Halarchaeum sp. CBA1220]|uniref:oligosaccharide flippase family protein n=1 Tax=Halarchaeum sp. CBA1220 TaxID=1853682 RepID=UPI000F3A904E|nr:lipopolysaccharide biosynthesis protein [Halarchaeum sp. CBA1220]QLC34902.1 lipopolysaccharide biosynthesis protein [Halarchaeum sp. CBA1220]